MLKVHHNSARHQSLCEARCVARERWSQGPVGAGATVPRGCGKFPHWFNHLCPEEPKARIQRPKDCSRRREHFFLHWLQAPSSAQHVVVSNMAHSVAQRYRPTSNLSNSYYMGAPSTASIVEHNRMLVSRVLSSHRCPQVVIAVASLGKCCVQKEVQALDIQPFPVHNRDLRSTD